MQPLAFGKRGKQSRSGYTSHFGIYLPTVYKELSLDQNVGEGGITWADILKDPDAAERTSRYVDISDLRRVLDVCMSSCLTPREERIMRMRFGYLPQSHPNYGEGMTLEGIGGVLDLSRERVRQIEVKAKTKLRLHLKNGGSQYERGLKLYI